LRLALFTDRPVSHGEVGRSPHSLGSAFDGEGECDVEGEGVPVVTVLTAERALRFVLTASGAVLLCAAFFVFLPTAQMASQHARLGLGEFPASALVEYLTRSISALYALHGGVLLVASRDPRRFQPLVVYLGCAHLVFGLTILGIDLRAGMPAWWTWGEGLPTAAVGLVMLVLMRRMRA
jgi:hypothetical protein